jgi:hypothetical protein
MSLIQEILSGTGVLWLAEKAKINANFEALNTDKAETSALPTHTSDLTNDSNFAVDADYVHTDNNLTDTLAANIVTNNAKNSYPSADAAKVALLSGTNTGDQDLSGYAETSIMTAALALKEDSVSGKGLSTNDYTTAEKNLVATITDKVTIETGKGLSSNDYTDTAKSKVDNLPADTNSSLSSITTDITDLQSEVSNTSSSAVSSPTSSVGVLILDLDDGNNFNYTQTESIASLVLDNVSAAGNLIKVTLIITMDATGGYTFVWPASILWAGGTDPILTTTANAVNVLEFITIDGGTTWYGSLYGANFS